MMNPKTLVGVIVVALVVVNVAGVLYFRSGNKGTAAQLGTAAETVGATENTDALRIEILKEGTGETAAAGDAATVHYMGTFTDGTVFDSSVTRGVPFTFTLGAGQVIPGWDVGVVGMKVGEKRRLVIAPELAYGATGVPGAIPPDSTLTFEVELLGVEHGTPAAQ